MSENTMEHYFAPVTIHEHKSSSPRRFPYVKHGESKSNLIGILHVLYIYI